MGGGDRGSAGSEDGTGRDGSWDDGTETGGYQVGKLSCVEAWLE